MNRSLWLLLAFVAMICFRCGVATGQAPTGLDTGPLNDELNVQRAQIDQQRVQRQTEVMRLEQIIQRFESRVTRLERQWLTVARLPGITISEAEAGVQFAEAQLKESEQLHQQGEISAVSVAAARLAVAQAQGQMDAAKAAHADSLIALELDVLYAERFLFEQIQERTRLERLVARGFTSSEGLRLSILDEGVAQKRLVLAKLRLETLQKSAGAAQPAAKSE